MTQKFRAVPAAVAVCGLVLAASASPCLDYAQSEFGKYLPQADFKLELKTDAALGMDAFRART